MPATSTLLALWACGFESLIALLHLLSQKRREEDDGTYESVLPTWVHPIAEADLGCQLNSTVEHTSTFLRSRTLHCLPCPPLRKCHLLREDVQKRGVQSDPCALAEAQDHHLWSASCHYLALAGFGRLVPAQAELTQLRLDRL